jgi:outer membrane protein assembly factor BamB
MRNLLSAIVFVFVVTAVSWPSDWPGWRGPTGQGATDETDLPLKWNGKTGENVVWKAKLPGQPGKARQDQNQSSPIVVKGKVVVTASYWPEGAEASKTQPEHHVACYDAADGKPLWDVKVEPGPWKFSDLRGGYTAPTPASDGHRVFVVFGSSVIAALDFDGKQLWRREIVPFDFDVALAASPVLFGDTVILQCDGTRKSSRLVAFDRKSGETMWEQKRPTNDFAHSTPTLAKIDGKDQLLVAGSNSLQGVDPGNGKVIWSFAARGDTVSPVVGGGVAYIDSGRGGPGFAVDPTGSGEVTKTHLKWKANNVPEGFSSPVIVGEHIYRVHSPAILKCWKRDSGEVVFSERLDEISTYASPIVTPEGRIYIASAGRTYVVKAGPKLEVLAVNDLGDASHASPAVSNGRIYLRGRLNLYCVGKK